MNRIQRRNRAGREIDPELVVHDEEGKPYSVRYDAVNATLLNEFLKEHRKVEEQTKKINRLESNLAEQRKDFEKCIAQQQKEIGVLAAGLQKVRAQLIAATSALGPTRRNP